MRNLYILTVFTVILGSWNLCASAQNVDFPDANLAAAVRISLGLAKDADISLTSLQELTQLHADNFEITNLIGLEKATRLTSLAIRDNPISDFAPLGSLINLTLLNLINTTFSISDLTILSPLTSLRRLLLSGNEISDLTDLPAFPNLASLELNSNQITDLTPLGNLTAPTKLTFLSLSDNQISNITPLARFTGLTQLFLSVNNIRDLTPLENLTNLEEWLRISSNQVSDLSPLAGLTKLRNLYFFRNQVRDLRPLAGLTKLQNLFFPYNQVRDLTPLENLTELRTLVICYNSYTDISPLQNLVNLSTLFIDEVFVEANEELVAATTDARLVLCAPRPEPVPVPVSPVEPEVLIETPLIVKKHEPVSVYRSPVAQDRVIFNEIRNAENDKNDWIELKNIADEDISLADWEISIVNSAGENANKDVDFVTFPDYTLPTSGILLIVNTDPNETDLIRGQNIIDPESNPDAPPQYLIVPEMKLPDTPYMLILRSATDKNENGEPKPLFEAPEAFEDLAGNYFRSLADYGTQLWPLINTWRPPPYYTALLTQGQAWQRIDVEKRGYTKEAWALSGYQSGLGYKPLAPMETSLGTPGYSPASDVNEIGTGRIRFSEVMYAGNAGSAFLPQWIELHNTSPVEVVNLKDWKLVIEARDSWIKHRYTTLVLNTLEVLPNQTVLVVTRQHRNSGNLPEHWVYDLHEHHSEDARRLGLRDNKVLGLEGFALKLLTPDDTLVDIAGNMNGENGLDTPAWKLPSGWTEDGARTSLIRRYEGNVALDGTASTSWVRTVDTAPMVAHVYWGSPTDNGTPGYKQGGILPVTLSHFRADRMESGVVLKWRTESEIENAGFNILRSQTRQGRYVKVNPSLIMGAGTISERHDYTWTDTTAKPNVSYYYQIEDMSFSGNRRRLATVRMRGHVSARGKLTTTWSGLKFEK